MIFRAMRVLGALALLGVGAVHLQQYYAADYSGVPTIGPLFLLNGISAGILGVALLLPIERLLRGRSGDAAVGMAATGGGMIALGAPVPPFLSGDGGPFGLFQTGHSPSGGLSSVTAAATLPLLAPGA